MDQPISSIHLLKELAIEVLGVLLLISSGVLCDSGGTPILIRLEAKRRL
jgi:hypothetical protein